MTNVYIISIYNKKQTLYPTLISDNLSPFGREFLHIRITLNDSVLNACGCIVSGAFLICVGTVVLVGRIAIIVTCLLNQIPVFISVSMTIFSIIELNND